MSEQAGEKTEQPTQRRLDEAIKKGQIARSAEVQTVFVLFAGLIALQMSAGDIWKHFTFSLTSIFSHLHDIPVSQNLMQGYAIRGLFVLLACVGPLLLAVCIGGLLAGAIQNRFQTSSEALGAHWDRVNPINGFKRIFSSRAGVPTLINLVKLTFVLLLCYSKIKQILTDPIFYTAVDTAKIASFMSRSCLELTLRVCSALVLIAAADYGYQFWRNKKDLMMTRQELKEEMKSQEGDPHIKARLRRRRQAKTFRQMLTEVPKADVIVTNPTHLAVALRYDRKTMKAPRIIAKGSRLNALKIREIATQHQIPIVENKPLARMMFKYGKVGGEIPAQLYAAVAEVLAYVYRINRYRYYTEQNQV